MGQSGLTIGLALYDDKKTLEKLWAGRMTTRRTRETVATAVTFGEVSD